MVSCEECRFDWETPPERLQAAVAAAADRCRATVGGALAGVADVEREHFGSRPAPEVWSPLEYLAHLRDVVAFYNNRIERVLTEERPHLPVGIRFAELAEARCYRDLDPVTVLTQCQQELTAAGRRVAVLESDDWDRIGIGSEGDERTVLTLARRLVHEITHHLQDIRRGANPGT